jgi:hypothetical protein
MSYDKSGMKAKKRRMNTMKVLSIFCLVLKLFYGDTHFYEKESAGKNTNIDM